jgi:hypothetical protein
VDQGFLVVVLGFDVEYQLVEKGVVVEEMEVGD